MADGKDQLIVLDGNLSSPANAKASDFKVAVPAAGMAEGANKLISDSVNQCGPRHTEDGGEGAGYGTPVPGDRSRVIAANFKVGQNDGGAGTSVSVAASVDFKNGDWTGAYPYKK